MASQVTKKRRMGSLPFGENLDSAWLSKQVTPPSKRSCQELESKAVPITPEQDIDSPNKRSPSYDPTYSLQIHDYYRRIELEFITPANVFGVSDIQVDICDRKRNILIDWLSDVAQIVGLQLSTYFLTIHLMDNVLAVTTVRKNRFQMLGCVCMLIAAKMEESNVPPVEDFVFLADRTFDAEAAVSMERLVLHNLNFNINIPTRYTFSERYAMAANLSSRERSMVNYLLEISYRNYALNAHPASLVAAATIHYALQLLRHRQSRLWPQVMVHFTGYSEEKIAPIVYAICKEHHLIADSNLRHMIKLYEKANQHYVALMEAPRTLRFDDPELGKEELLING